MENIIADTKDIERTIRTLIQYIGEDPDREGLIKTPDRIIRMWREIFRGYDESKKPKITTFSNNEHSTDMVFDTGDYYSMCEHHILPFFGRYYFAYIPAPDGRILGISKIARVVGYCAARLQLQERLASDIVKMLTDALDGKVLGMALVMKGKHLCKTMRGVRNDGNMSVAHLEGVFKNNKECRDEFYKLIDLQRE
jgi:GTP cyclohydrolase I